jgi:Ala-tRNA(Pro) deacylase
MNFAQLSSSADGRISHRITPAGLDFYYASNALTIVCQRSRRTPRCIMRMARTVQRSLEKAQCEYDIVSHPHSASSLETARVAGIPAERVAKSVILDDHHGHYLMAVLPASRHLDLSKVRSSGEWQVSRESNLAHLFDDCERGAVPALGESYGLEVVIDPLLTRQKDIYLEAGNHVNLLRMDMPEFLKMVPHAEVRELSH